MDCAVSSHGRQKRTAIGSPYSEIPDRVAERVP
jgi:hypothetical protein